MDDIRCPHCNNNEIILENRVLLDKDAVYEYECERCKETFTVKILAESKE